jgi:hypothetical protein
MSTTGVLRKQWRREGTGSVRSGEGESVPPRRARLDAGVPLVPMLVGLLIRIGLAPYTADSNDVATWFHTSLSGFYGLHLYDRPGFAYPPIWGYLLEFIGRSARLAGQAASLFGFKDQDLVPASRVAGDFSPVVTSPVFNLIFKTVLFGVDLATGLLIYAFVAGVTKSKKRATVAFALWFLNPLVIYQSAVHGAADTLVGFAVVSTVILVFLGRPFLAGAAWTIGILTKLSPLALGLELVLLIAIGIGRDGRTGRLHVKEVAAFVAGAVGSALLLLMPEVVYGSVSNMIHNNFARGQEPVIIGGLSLLGVRHLKPFSWLLAWGFDHSSLVVRASLVAQLISSVAWGLWALIVARKNPLLGLLGGAVGTLATLTLVAPASNPQYVLWWLPTLVVLVTLSRSGYWQLGVLTVAPLTFAIAILGPLAVLAPLSVYTHVISAADVGRSVVDWYVAPGRLWGSSLADDFFAPAVITTVVALASLFVLWIRMGRRGRPQVL